MPFDQQVNIVDNERLRIPQRDGWQHIAAHYAAAGSAAEVGIVLPVG